MGVLVGLGCCGCLGWARVLCVCHIDHPAEDTQLSCVQ